MSDRACGRMADSLRRLENWIEERDYAGYEPFDGLLSPLRALTAGSLLMDRVLLQLVRQSPFNLRPLLGIKPQPSTKGRGYMAAGYLDRWKSTRDGVYREKAERCLEWLIDNKSPKFEEFSWGNHFPFAGRSGRYESHEPIIVWTALIGQAFLDAYEEIGDERYLNIASSSCEWVMALPRERTASGICISYYAFKQLSIHNSNMLGAALLARTARHTGRGDYLDLARSAMDYSCTRQLPDGAWFYGEASNQRWIDNFHTGYNLDSLQCYLDHTGDGTYRDCLRKGLDYYLRTFFREDGCPGYYHNRTYPIDSQCISQAIETLAKCSTDSEEAMTTAVRVALWAIDNMQDPEGYFYYRKYPLFKAKTPMLHWAQATTYRSFALLLRRCGAPGGS